MLTYSTSSLRYGWISEPEIKSTASQALPCTTSEHKLNSIMISKQNIETENQGSFLINHLVTAEPIINMTPSSTPMPLQTVESGCLTSNINALTYHGSTEQLSSIREEAEDLAILRQVENMVYLHLSSVGFM